MYVNPGSLIAVSVIFIVLGSGAVAARFATRLWLKQNFGPDDYLCIPALAFLITTGALIIYGTAGKAFGYHVPPTDDLEQMLQSIAPQMQLLLKLEFWINFLNPVGTGFIRLSFMFFYRRIFRGKVFNITSWIIIGFLITWSCVSVIAYLNLCSPISDAWSTVANLDAHCHTDPRWLLAAFGLIGLVLDITILVYPFFWIWRLKMDRSKKQAVSSVFLCGVFIVSMSALRAAAGVESATVVYGKEQDYIGLKSTSDVMGRVSILEFWQYIENGTGMVVCCLTSLRPILTWRLFQSTGNRLYSMVSMRKIVSRSRGSETSSTNGLTSAESTRKSSHIIITRTFGLSSVQREKDAESV